MTPQYRPNFRVSQMVAGARRRNSPADLLERGERVLPLFRLPASLFSIAFTGQGLLHAEFLARLQVEGVPFDLSDYVLLHNLSLEARAFRPAPSLASGRSRGDLRFVSGRKPLPHDATFRTNAARKGSDSPTNTVVGGSMSPN
jgi:hypothetical protein